MSKTKSSGPKSMTGKEISSINAFKHGLSAQKWISLELGKYFEQILKALTHEYLPQTPTEILLVERIATTMTKAKRLTNIEDAQYELAKELVAQKLGEPGAHFAQDVLKPSRDNSRNQAIIELQQDASMPRAEIMNLINRQQNALSRQLSKEFLELISVVERRKNRVVDDEAVIVERPNESEKSA